MENSKSIYLVGFVVVLRVVFEDLLLFWVVEVADEVIEVEFFPPFLAINKPITK